MADEAAKKPKEKELGWAEKAEQLIAFGLIFGQVKKSMPAGSTEESVKARADEVASNIDKIKANVAQAGIELGNSDLKTKAEMMMFLTTADNSDKLAKLTTEAVKLPENVRTPLLAGLKQSSGAPDQKVLDALVRNSDSLTSSIASVNSLITKLNSDPANKDVVKSLTDRISDLAKSDGKPVTVTLISKTVAQVQKLAEISAVLEDQLADPAQAASVRTFLAAALSSTGGNASLADITAEKIEAGIQATSLLSQLYPQAKPEDLSKYLTSLETLKTAASSNPTLKGVVDNAMKSTGGKPLGEGATLVARYAIENPAKFTKAITKLTAEGDKGSAPITAEQIEKILANKTASENLIGILENPDIALQILQSTQDPEIKAKLEKAGISLGDGTGDVSVMLQSTIATNIIKAVKDHPEQFNSDTITLMTHLIKKAPDGVLEKMKSGDVGQIGIFDMFQLSQILEDPEVAKIMSKSPNAMKGALELAKSAAAEGHPDVVEAIEKAQKNKMAEIYARLRDWFGGVDIPGIGIIIAVATYVIANNAPDFSKQLLEAKSPIALLAPGLEKNMENLLGGKSDDTVVASR